MQLAYDVTLSTRARAHASYTRLSTHRSMGRTECVAQQKCARRKERVPPMVPVLRSNRVLLRSRPRPTYGRPPPPPPPPFPSPSFPTSFSPVARFSLCEKAEEPRRDVTDGVLSRPLA
jgi:hypothetical protein